MDITLCKGGKCPKKDKCYRFKAIPDKHWQSFFKGVPYKKKRCMYFMKMMVTSEVTYGT